MQPLISVVVPMYNESAVLDILFQRLIPVLQNINPAWEVVCVNDGSSDDTLPRLRGWAKHEPRIRYISLSRNFGKEAALTAGLDAARGKAVIPLDADLQDPPELIPDLVAKWSEGWRVVLATRVSREGEGWFKRFTAAAFYRFMGMITPFDLPPNTGDFRLMDASVVEVIRHMPERTRMMKGLFAWAGFKPAVVYYQRPPREGGMPKQNWRMLWRLAKDGVFSFTTLPLRLSTYVGALISLGAFGYGMYIIIQTLIHGVQTPGYASLMVVMLFTGGLQLLSLGIIGEYVGRTYRESKHRPLYVVEEVGGN